MTDTSREALMRRALVSMADLNSRIMEPFFCSLDQDAARVLSDCVAMLEADKREIEATERQVEILSNELSKCSKQAQAVEPVLFIDADTLAMAAAHVGAWKPGHELEGNLPLYLHPAAPAQQVAVPAKLIDALLHQIDIGDFVDRRGHSAKMLSAVRDVMELRGRS